MAEVYEVATFYHHFDVVKEGEGAPAAAHGARVRDAFLPDGRRASSCSRSFRRSLGPNVRVIGAPCIGRCAEAPAVCVGQNAFGHATRTAVEAVRRSAKRSRAPALQPIGYARISRQGRLQDLGRMRRRQARYRCGHQDDGGLGPARTGRRGIPGRAQVEDRARRAGPAAHGGEHRRGRAGHVQGPPLPRARSAPLPRGHADRRVGRRHRGHLRLPARRVPRLPRDARARDRGAARPTPPATTAAHPPAPRRRRLHLRRRVGDDRVDRGQARHAAAAPAVRRAGGPLRAAHARAQHGDALLGARHPRARRRVVRERRAATAARACARSRSRAA